MYQIANNYHISKLNHMFIGHIKVFGHNNFRLDWALIRPGFHDAKLPIIFLVYYYNRGGGGL